jgi:predicted RNase H-like HicB family nuclease
MSHIYTIILEPAEEGGFVVREDAIALVLESRRERGEPIP